LDLSFHTEARRYKDANEMIKGHHELRNAVSKTREDFSKADYDNYTSMVDTYEGIPRDVNEYQIDTSEKTYRDGKEECTLRMHITEDGVDQLKQIAYGAGLSHKQAQAAYEGLNHIAAQQKEDAVDLMNQYEDIERGKKQNSVVGGSV
jgi:hypothetical protein